MADTEVVEDLVTTEEVAAARVEMVTVDRISRVKHIMSTTMKTAVMTMAFLNRTIMIILIIMNLIIIQIVCVTIFPMLNV